MADRVQPARRYGEVTRRKSVTYAIVAAGLSSSPVAAKQLQVRAIRRIVALAEVYGRIGRQDLVAGIIRRLEQAAGPDQRLSLGEVLTAEGKADGAGNLAILELLPQLADPNPETLRRVKAALASEAIWAERALKAVERQWPTA